ncbi:MAG TPA: hypothetical protein VHV56_08920 [Pseudolabrys sp.]|jgi:hypothetical protein|nr:hypothetical protein [Pseudolabrys sp.]
MKAIVKYAGAAALVGALALATAVPSQARHWHNGGAIIGGLAAGAIIGAAAANANNGYYYGPGPYYGDGPGPYAYQPGPVYAAPGPVYRGGQCWHVTDSMRGYGYYGACN